MLLNTMQLLVSKHINSLAIRKRCNLQFSMTVCVLYIGVLLRFIYILGNRLGFVSRRNIL